MDQIFLAKLWRNSHFSHSRRGEWGWSAISEFPVFINTKYAPTTKTIVWSEYTCVHTVKFMFMYLVLFGRAPAPAFGRSLQEALPNNYLKNGSLQGAGAVF